MKDGGLLNLNWSAQRLSASKVLSLGKRARSVLAGLGCSTPFGIKGSFTAIRAISINFNIRCSTPFGIKGSFTR